MLLALDSNVLIAALSPHETNASTAETLVHQIAIGKHRAILSAIIFGEVLSLNNPAAPAKLDLELFIHQFVNAISIPADDSVCQQAGLLRRSHGFRLPDAIHLATALQQKVELFITNDRQLATAARSLLATKTLAEL